MEWQQDEREALRTEIQKLNTKLSFYEELLHKYGIEPKMEAEADHLGNRS